MRSALAAAIAAAAGYAANAAGNAARASTTATAVATIATCAAAIAAATKPAAAVAAAGSAVATARPAASGVALAAALAAAHAAAVALTAAHTPSANGRDPLDDGRRLRHRFRLYTDRPHRADCQGRDRGGRAALRRHLGRRLRLGAAHIHHQPAVGRRSNNGDKLPRHRPRFTDGGEHLPHHSLVHGECRLHP